MLEYLSELLGEKLALGMSISAEEALFWQLVQLKLTKLNRKGVPPVSVLIRLYQYLTNVTTDYESVQRVTVADFDAAVVLVQLQQADLGAPMTCLDPTVKELVESLKSKLTVNFANEASRELLQELTDEHYFLRNSSLFDGDTLKCIELALPEPSLQALDFEVRVKKALKLDSPSWQRYVADLATDGSRMGFMLSGLPRSKAAENIGEVWQQYQTIAPELDLDLRLITPTLLPQVALSLWDKRVYKFAEWLIYSDCPIEQLGTFGYLTGTEFEVDKDGRGWSLIMKAAYRSIHGEDSDWDPKAIGLRKVDVNEDRESEEAVMQCVFKFQLRKQFRSGENRFVATSRIRITPYTRKLYNRLVELKAKSELPDQFRMVCHVPTVPGSVPRPARHKLPLPRAAFSPPPKLRRSKPVRPPGSPLSPVRHLSSPATAGFGLAGSPARVVRRLAVPSPTRGGGGKLYLLCHWLQQGLAI